MSDLEFNFSHNELSITLSDRIVPADQFGLIARPLVEIPEDFLIELFEDIDSERGPLTPEQKRTINIYSKDALIEYLKGEHNMSDHEYEHVARFLPELFVRAYPILSTFNVCSPVSGFDFAYDGFYGPQYEGPSLPAALSAPDTRTFIKEVFGEYRKSFARKLHNATLNDFGKTCFVGKVAFDPDLAQEILDKDIDFESIESLQFIFMEDIEQFFNHCRKSTKMNLLLDLSETQSSITSACIELLDFINYDEITPIRAKTWNEMLHKMSSIKVINDCVFPEHELWSVFDNKIIEGYELKSVRTQKGLLDLSKELNNCIYQAEYTSHAMNMTSSYFALHKNGNVVGALELVEKDDSFAILQLEGYNNSQIDKSDDFKHIVERIINEEYGK